MSDTLCYKAHIYEVRNPEYSISRSYPDIGLDQVKVHVEEVMAELFKQRRTRLAAVIEVTGLIAARYDKEGWKSGAN